MNVSFKPGVRIHGLRAEMAIAAVVVGGVYEAFGQPCIVTSAVDGKHEDGSLHYCGAALDFRTRDPGGAWAFDDATRSKICIEIRNRLGDDWDVVDEGDHIHVEFQPKKPYALAP